MNGAPLMTAVIIVSVACCWPSIGGAADEGSEPTALVDAVERENPDCVERNADGLVVSLLLRHERCNPTNLASVASIRGLRELRLQGGTPDAAAVRSLAASASLSSVSFGCFRELPAGVLPAVADLPNIRHLRLVYSDVPSEEYACLAGMSNLTELVITFSRNFTDAHLYSLKDAPALRSLKIQSEKLSSEASRMPEQFRSLTNAVLSGKTVWRTNWHPRLEWTEPEGPR
jgi:hypothetical protein